MKNRLQIFGIIIGVILISIFPILAVVSFFTDVEYEDNKEEYIQFEDVKNEILKLSKNKSQNVINVDEIIKPIEEIKEEVLPLGVQVDSISISGKDVKNNFAAHKDKINKNKLVFEIVTQKGENLFFKSLEELEFYVDDNDEYQKYFLLDDNSNLIRYTFLEINKVIKDN